LLVDSSERGVYGDVHLVGGCGLACAVCGRKWNRWEVLVVTRYPVERNVFSCVLLDSSSERLVRYESASVTRGLRVCQVAMPDQDAHAASCASHGT